MERVYAIMKHPLFDDALKKIAMNEAAAIFCKHDLDHFLAVARIAHILCMEDGFDAEKDIIYAAALLHDTGRWRQYEDGTPHEEASARIARAILPECGFDIFESALIIDAILSHRSDSEEKPGFSGYLYRADKLSRLCFDCAASEACNWEIKNTQLTY